MPERLDDNHMTIYAVECSYPSRKLPYQISEKERKRYIAQSGYSFDEATKRWAVYEQQILEKHKILPEITIIALFNSKNMAVDFAARHDGDGGCRLNVVERNHLEPLEYEIRVIYG